MDRIEALFQREIPIADEEILRRCATDGEGTVPDNVRRAYWHYKSIRDRCENSQLHPFELYQVVLTVRLLAGTPPHDNPAKPFDIALAVTRGQVTNHTFLRIWWRKAEAKAQFIALDRRAKLVLVLLEFDERKLPYDKVLGLWVDKPEPGEGEASGHGVEHASNPPYPP